MRFQYLALGLVVLLMPLTAYAEDAGAPLPEAPAPEEAVADVGGQEAVEAVADAGIAADKAQAAPDEPSVALEGVLPLPADALGSDALGEMPDGESVSLLMSLAQSGQWSLFAGVLIMLLLNLANRMNILGRANLPPQWTPWVALALGVLSAIGVMLASGIDLQSALLQGAVAGMAATGGWELIGKQILKKKSAA